MALCIWLPLNGNLTNQGISNISTSVIGTTAYATDGKIGKGLSCSGSTYWIASNITLDAEASICCWAKTSTDGKMPWVLTSNASTKLNLYCATKYALNVGDGGANRFLDSSGNPISVFLDNKWHHLVVTFGNSQAKLYIDGTYQGTAPTFRNPTTTNNSVKIAGGFNGGHTYDWVGAISDFRVYDHCLSAEEIREIANGLIIHLKLDDLSSGYATDSSGYHRHGTLINAPTTSSSTPRYNASTTLISTSKQAIKITDNSWMIQGMTDFTINLWAKSTSWSGAHLISCTETGGFNTENGSSGYLRFPVHTYTDEEQTTASYNYTNTGIKISDLSQTEWQMFTFVYNNTGTYIYINGELYKTYSFTSYGMHYNTNARLFLGCEASVDSPTTPYFNGSISDFRFYCTSLLDTEIKKLYNISMGIDKQGQVHTGELIETSNNIFTRENILKYKKSGASANTIILRNGKHCIAVYPAQFYNNYTLNDSTVSAVLINEFEPNTQYLFDIWEDSDESINSGGTGWVTSGIRVIYSDGTENSSLLVVGSENGGWQHKRLLSNPNKSVQRIIFRYGVNQPVYYSLDSFIGPVNQFQVLKSNNVQNTTICELEDKLQIYHGGDTYTTQIIER